MDDVNLPLFRTALRRWYRSHARDLPWRREVTPYRTWISEIMLQQTQVSKVIPYFERFLEAFPDLATLADAEEEAVLRIWEGLGYYRRARQLHKAAKLIQHDHDGQIPTTPEKLQSLPGIGRYTARAILSIAFGRRLPILEANTVRLLSRLYAVDTDVQQAATQERLWQLAEQVLPARAIGSFNQALMELGSQVCYPRRPACGSCPVRQLCAARQGGLENLLPVNSRRVQYESLDEAAVIVRDNKQRVLLRRCGDDERWAGLWDYPRFPLDLADPGGSRQQQLAEGVHALTAVEIGPALLMTTMQHSVTRFRITLHCYQANRQCRGTRRVNQHWIPLERLGRYPLSSMGRAISEQLLATLP